MIDIEMFVYDGHKEWEFTITHSDYQGKKIYTEDIVLKDFLSQLLGYKAIFNNWEVIFLDGNYWKIYIKKEFNFISFFQVNFWSKESYIGLYKDQWITKEYLDYIIEWNDRYDNNTYTYADLVFQCSYDEWKKWIQKFLEEYKDDLKKI